MTELPAPAALILFGATSTMATELARRYATRNVMLLLVARDPDALSHMQADLSARSVGAVHGFVSDLSDLAAHEGLLAQINAFLPAEGIIHALIAYGQLTQEDKARTDTVYFEEQMRTNFLSAAHLAQVTTHWLDMRKDAASLAVITSVAGDRGRQSNYVYGAAKGGLSRYLQGLQHAYFGKNIAIVDIKPGFVDTKMTASFTKGPLWASAEKVAADIEQALGKGRSGTVYTPWFWRFIILAIQHVPAFIFHRTKL